MAAMEQVEPQSLKKLSFKSLKRALDLFAPTRGHFPLPDPESEITILFYHQYLIFMHILLLKMHKEYGSVKNASGQPGDGHAEHGTQDPATSSQLALPVCTLPSFLLLHQIFTCRNSLDYSCFCRFPSTSALMERLPSKWPRPIWHPPWRNYRVISGHLGWVRSIAFDPSNSWFCTGSADRTIKIWDVASGKLKLTLTGHIEQVRGLAVSQRHTYMFSAGDDKLVKCWDLEQNKVIRHYHGHLSGVYCLALHPTIDLLLTGGRDSVCRVWDIRSKAMAFALSGHDNTVCSIFTRPTNPQVVTGSHDTTIKFWDLVAGKTMATLTHHKKSVRAMAMHPNEQCFASASADNIKKFNLPKGEFMHNMLSQQKTIINAMAVNEDGVMATAGDNGSLWFWDWKSGHNFQQAQTIVQPGSLDSEASIYALSYDISGSRLVTCEADKTIKMWKEDETATPETHPLNFKPPKDLRRF
ncbi:Protein pleiotropic regulator PRL2 [Acorus calamus]|uniref:Protein pleiotropic regulator PRL2 n=1 Tax=Acorus calamus TaxID=4465 RepID=A0AAV9EWH9_ACOCL|nr:Protein pleiotropic regulator PRL2 [Acorus calamus]